MRGDQWATVVPLVIFLLGGIGWLVKWALDRLSRPAADELTLSQAWQITSGGQIAEIQRLSEKIAALEAADRERAAQIRQLQDRERAKDDRIDHLEEWVNIARRGLRPLLAWLDAGAVPPPPIIDDALRAFARQEDW